MKILVCHNPLEIGPVAVDLLYSLPKISGVKLIWPEMDTKIIKSADFALLLSPPSHHYEMLEQHQKMIEFLPVVIINGRDMPAPTNWERLMKGRTAIIEFRREWLFNDNLADNIYPLNFCSREGHLMKPEFKKKEIDIFFAGTTNSARPTHIMRKFVGKRILDYFPKSIILFERYSSDSEHKSLLHSSWIGLQIIVGNYYEPHIGTSGYSSQRSYDIPSYGSFALRNEISKFQYIPNDFTDGINVKEFPITLATLEDDTKNIIEVIEDLLSNKDKLKEMTEAGFQHLKKYHLAKHRANYLINIVEERLKLC